MSSSRRSSSDTKESLSKAQGEGGIQVLEPVNKNLSEDVSQNDDETRSNEVPQGRQIGFISAVFLMVNRMLGTGVFSTSSTLLAQGGSPGLVLIYWLIGAIVAAAGYAVYASWASALPRASNGGELNYLQKAYGRPKYLLLAVFSAQALLLGQAAGNAYAAGSYFIRAGGTEVHEWHAKAIGIGILFSALILHGCFMKYGLIFQNSLGFFKVAVLLVIVFSGFDALAGHTKGPAPDNFNDAFEGSRSDIYGISASLYNAGWSYVGYSNVFYALGEVKRPLRTLKFAGPLAIGVLAVLYTLAQVAYFAAVPKEEILASKQIVAALYFKHMFGEKSARALSVFVGLSAVANVYSVIFSQGRLNQALGRDGLVPFSKFLASNRPFGAPLAGIGWHVIVTLVILLAPPAGDTYNLILSLSSYPLNVVNFGVGLGLVLAYLPRRFRPTWAQDFHSPIHATMPVAIFFTLVSAFLVITPWIPPKKASDAVYAHIWYGLAPALAFGILTGGAVYWLLWAKLLPHFGNYVLVPEGEVLSDGTHVTSFKKVPK